MNQLAQIQRFVKKKKMQGNCSKSQGLFNSKLSVEKKIAHGNWNWDDDVVLKWAIIGTSVIKCLERTLTIVIIIPLSHYYYQPLDTSQGGRGVKEVLLPKRYYYSHHQNDIKILYFKPNEFAKNTWIYFLSFCFRPPTVFQKIIACRGLFRIITMQEGCHSP